ncbi:MULTISPECIES: lipocalin family protein [Flavobacterium]|uniref:lipocalin family protein n=1 Tax=Flavobacterium TaxID=237 RepID=UPI001FCC33E9|nr:MULTISPECIES: lipocalin family protein [Flavobacterium]UOK42268.1 lipocalin family protein [Flavobacterium enshiense]
MKDIYILFVSALVLGLSFASCNEDDDSSNSSAQLEGKWIFSKEGSITDGNEELWDYEGNEDGCSKDYIMVNSNGSLTDVDYDSTDSPCQMFTTNGTWTRSGNNLTINIEEISFTGEIVNLTSRELKLKFDNVYIIVFTRG